MAVALTVICSVVARTIMSLFDANDSSLPWSLVLTIIAIAVLAVYFLGRSKPVTPGPSGKFCPHCGREDMGGLAICDLCGEGACPQCGYNLFGNTSGKCPECGTALNTIGMFINVHAHPPMARPVTEERK